MKTFLISDTHFGHARILQFQKEHRPFDTIEEHDEELIRLWNSVVGVGDIVYHLGDFGFGKNSLGVIERLRGVKYLVRGNHDKYPASVYLDAGFDFVENYCVLDGWLLTHIPIHPQEVGRWKGNIHGHLHSKRVLMGDGVIDERYICVSCEQVKLKPKEYICVVQ